RSAEAGALPLEGRAVRTHQHSRAAGLRRAARRTAMQYEGRHLKRFAATGRVDSLEPPPTLSEIYHESSKLAPLGAQAYGLEINRANASPLIKKLTSAPFKVYSLGPAI